MSARGNKPATTIAEFTDETSGAVAAAIKQ